MKKSFSLLLTMILILVFTFLSINIYEVKSFSNKNIQTQKAFIQAKNHISFLKNIVKDHSFENSLEIQNSSFEIKAIKKDGKLHLFVKSKYYNISIYESLEL